MLKFSGASIVAGTSRADKIEGDTQLPAEVDVVIIGGGIIGCVTALELAERGVSVALCEKGAVAGEASGRAVGLLEYELLSPIKMELLAHSLERWRTLPERVGGDMGFKDQGMVSLFNDENHAAVAESWLKDMQGIAGIDARMLSPEEINQLDPAFGTNWQSGLHQANAIAVEPRLAAPAIARAAREKGAKVLQSCAVRTIERQAGRITSVVTEKGAIKTSNIVIAGGIWSSMLIAHLGIELPQMMIFAQQNSVEPIENGPRIDGMNPAGYFRREPDGGYLFGAAAGRVPITLPLLKSIPKLMKAPTDVDQEMYPAVSLNTFLWEMRASRKPAVGIPSVFEEYRVFQPAPMDELEGAVEEMGKYIPAFANCKVRERYTGSLMTTMDNLGVISPVQSIPGLFIATGMLYGLTTSAATGEILADMITGETPKVNVSPYRYERLIDGTPFVFHP